MNKKRSVLFFLILTAGVRPVRASIEMSSWLSYQIQHVETLDLYGQQFTSICVFAYDFDTNDNIRPARSWVNSTLDRLMASKKPGRPVFITIVNDIESFPPRQHNGQLILRILSDPVKRARHIQQLVALSARADGIDIDYEGLLSGIRPYFSQFIQELRQALPPDKLLSVVCQPKTDSLDGERGNAIDWEAIHPYADVVKVMTYYYSYASSPPGPSVPLDTADDVISLAVSQIPKSKLHIVLTQFGWDWPDGGSGEFLTFHEAMSIAQAHGATPFRDSASQYLRVDYIDNGTPHQIWFPDKTTLLAQINLSQSLGVNRVDVWEMGVGDAAFWTWVTNNTTNPNATNPKPVLSTVSPNNALQGSAGFTLALTGQKFMDGSLVKWNNANRATTFVSATQLTAQIPATDLESAGVFSVTVFNPPPDGGTSQPKTFTVKAPNPSPILSAISPSATTAGNAGFTLTLTGANFITDSQVQWNGSTRATSWFNSTRLTIAVLPADIAAAGSAKVRVFTPVPGGGTSSELTLTINPQISPNPPPVLTSLSPATVAVGAPAFTLNVNGSGFVGLSVIQWNGQIRPTTVLSGNLLTTSISADDIDPGDVMITVFNPAPGGGTSKAATLTVANISPLIESVDPPSVPAGGGDLTITIHGSEFLPSSIVRFNGEPRLTAWLSATRLTALIPAEDIETEEVVLITILNPGNNISEPHPFVVSGPSPPLIPPLQPSPPSEINAPDPSDLAQARVYPNPWMAGRHAGASITFDRLTPNSTLKIFTISSRWVKTLQISQGAVSWDLTNEDREPVASGYYIYLITDSNGAEKKGKVAVVR